VEPELVVLSLVVLTTHLETFLESYFSSLLEVLRVLPSLKLRASFYYVFSSLEALSEFACEVSKAPEASEMYQNIEWI